MSVSILASDIANNFSTTLVGSDVEVTRLAPLGSAGASALTFANDPERHADQLLQALTAGACVLVPTGAFMPDTPSGCLIRVGNPRAAFAQASARYFAPRVEPGIAETARVHPTAVVHDTAHIGEFTVVGEGAVVGAHSELRNHVVIGRNVRIGEHALIKSHAVIGEEGFGMEVDAAGNNFRIPHLGSVVLGDHVEIGGFTTICSGTIEPTTVDDYAKIDDHVHIAHNCRIGKNVIVTACAEVSGSVVLEERVWLGPNSSIIEGRTLGQGSLVGIGAVVLKSVPEQEVWVGNPAKMLSRSRTQ